MTGLPTQPDVQRGQQPNKPIDQDEPSTLPSEKQTEDKKPENTRINESTDYNDKNPDELGAPWTSSHFST
jgi:hypothetical protein